MRQSEQAVAWVVYLITDPKCPEGRRAVCEQGEWDQMERDRPGHHTLVRAGITSEAEAERLARGTSGDAKHHLPRRRP
jgi:hypothetical protein